MYSTGRAEALQALREFIYLSATEQRLLQR